MFNGAVLMEKIVKIMGRCCILLSVFLLSLVQLPAEENNSIEADHLLQLAGLVGDLDREEAVVAAGRFSAPEVLNPQKLDAEDRCFAFLQCRPPKIMAEKMVAFLNPVFPDSSLKILPMMFLGLWGFPDFAGFSADDGLTFVLFENDESFESSAKIGHRNWILLAKVNPDQSLPAALKLQGISAETCDGWTLISPNPDLVQRLLHSSKLPFILSLAKAPPSDDFRLSICPNYFESAIKIAAKNLEASPFQAVQIRGTLEGDLLRGSVLISARDPQLLGRLASGEERPELTDNAINFIHDTDFSSMIVRFSPKYTERILRDCLSIFLGKMMTEGEKKAARRIDSLLAEMGRHYRGVYLESSSIGKDSEEMVRHLLVMDRIRYPRLLRWISTLYPAIAILINGQSESVAILEPLHFSSAVRGNAFIHGRVPVIEGELSGCDGDGRIAWSWRRYYSALGDCLLVSNSREEMEKMIDDCCRSAKERALDARSARRRIGERFDFSAEQIADLAITVSDVGSRTCRPSEGTKTSEPSLIRNGSAIRGKAFLRGDGLEFQFEGRGTGLGNMMRLFSKASHR